MRQFSRLVPRGAGRALRRYATLADVPKPGDSLHGFTVKQVKEVPEFNLVASQLVHDKTGAEHLHISREDNNNVWAIGFGTPSNNSTGVAHILEHTTLCGSKKYPVRDPFFKMLNRTYVNFMNAFTSQDNTFYPFATTNPTDYDNLRSVYLDATFNPLLRELDFRQEGWRLEHKDPRDPATPILFKGVVFNEMKGVMSDVGNLYYEEFQKNMYPDTIYGCNSGGNPLDIPALTYNDLKTFHDEHYHPSNAKIYTYGDIPLESQLSALNERLTPFSRLNPQPFSASTPRFPSPRRVLASCPVDPLSDPNKQNVTSISFHANERSDGLFEHFALGVLVALLTDGHGAPLRKALLDTNIGTDWSVNAGHHAFGQTAYVAFGVQGVKQEDEGLVESEIMRVLGEVAETGFEKDRIEGILHQMELGLKHQSAKFGIGLMWQVATSWFDGVDPIEALQFNARIEKLRAEIAKGGFFEGMVKKYFLENQSRLILTMRPDPQFKEKFNAKENVLLSEKLASLSEADKKEVYDEGLKLLEAQEKPEDLSSLPTLTVEDIPKKTHSFPIEKEDVDNVPVQWQIAPTNGITYLRAMSSLEGLPSHLRPYLPLFADALSSLGTTTKSPSEFEDEINLKTDGIACSVHITTTPTGTTFSDFSDLDLGQLKESLTIKSACLDKNVTAMYDLVRQFMSETNWDNEKKLDSLIKNSAGAVVTEIASAGSQYASLYASSMLTPAGAAQEVAGGMSQIRLLCQMARWHAYQEVIGRLKEIARYVFSQKSMRIAITCGHETQAENRNSLSGLLETLPNHSLSRPSPLVISSTLPSKAFFSLPYAVNYAALTIRGVPYTHPDSAVLRLLGKYVEQKRIHPEVREKGGAYGGKAHFDRYAGIFKYISYRDPSFERSLEIMKDSGRWATEQKIEADDLLEMKLSTFKNIDAPISVREEGMHEFLYGITYEMQQTWRERALNVNADQLLNAAQKYLVEPVTKGLTSEAVLGQMNDHIAQSSDWEKFDFDLSIEEEPEAESAAITA